MRVLVDSPDASIGELLRERLPGSDFHVVSTQPGPAFLRTARCVLPDIAVVDRVHERAEAALLEIAVLKDARPGVRIIALSEESSPKDARVVEQGIFYYMTLPTGRELVQVIRAAARAIASEAKAVGGRRA
ncbi:MAG: hypothetical protein HY721_02720 [Planctomycetes bacterium]|nr:hypothetical protein [Planctomycetota bacterium]